MVGILPHVIKTWDDWPEEAARFSHKYGRTWGGGLPNVPGMNGAFFFVVDEESIHHILSKNFENYQKGKAFQSLYGDLLGWGIFATDGNLWRVHRKVMSNMFSRNLLRQTSKVSKAKLDEVAELMQNRIASSPDEVANLDLQDIFFRMTFDITSYVAFGCEMNSFKADGQHRFACSFDEMQLLITVSQDQERCLNECYFLSNVFLTIFYQHSFKSSIKLLATFQERILDPLYELKRLFQIGSREKRIAQLKQILFEEAMEIINSRRRSVADGDKLGPDLLSRFLDHAKKVGQPLRDDELQSVVMNVMIAGRDTTACALSWGFYELTKRPDIVQNITQEVAKVCGNEDPDYSFDKISELRYTHAVVMEILRLHPSVPNDHKYAVCDDVLPDGTFIPAGAAVAWLPLAMGRDKNIWGEDALEFKPARFLNAKEPSMYKYPVFNAGPRTCLGKPLALSTMKLTLAYLLPKFDFEDSLGHSGEYKWTMVRSMKDGFQVGVSVKK